MCLNRMCNRNIWFNPQSNVRTVVTLTVGVRRYCAYDSGRQNRCHINCVDGVCVVALLTGIVATGFTNQVSMRRNQPEFNYFGSD